jgi:CheY-like chemotaxis protein
LAYIQPDKIHLLRINGNDMSEKPFVIFIVDDNAILRMVVMDQLAGHNYILHEFSSGDECIAMMHLQPNLILMDIEMPEKSGIETCHQLRSDGHTDVQVIFNSSHDDLDILLQAFDAGGNDFISKNAPKDVLLRKIDIAKELEVQKYRLKSQMMNAQQVAMTAMSSLGETGIVLQFLRNSFACTDLPQLGVLIEDVLQQFDLKGLVRLSDDFGTHDFSAEVLCTPLEQSILAYVSKLGHLFHTQDRLVLNYPHITLLIMDLDNGDADGLGRLRDNLAIIAEGAGVRIDAMMAEQYKLRNVQQVAVTAMSSLGETGTMLQFLRSSFSCESIQQLGLLIVDTLEQFSLKGLIRLADDFQQCDFGAGVECTPKTQTILGNAVNLGHVQQVEDRLVLNYPHITILILELNLEDNDGIGRLRDNLSIMAEGTGVRIEALVSEQLRLKNANQVAFTAMSSLGESGVMLQFLRTSFNSQSIEQLGPLVADTLQQFDLTGLVRLHSDFETFDFGAGIECTQREQLLLDQACQMDRIHQIGDRLMLNYPHTTIIIMNLDLNDAELVGRIRDNIAIIAEGTGVRIEAMISAYYQLKQANDQLENIKELNVLFDEVEKHQQANRNQFEHLIEDHTSVMEEGFARIGLTDAQESMLHNAVLNLSNEMESLFSNDYRLSLKLREIIARQKQMLGTS